MQEYVARCVKVYNNIREEGTTVNKLWFSRRMTCKKVSSSSRKHGGGSGTIFLGEWQYDEGNMEREEW